jgi:DNA replication licensing factor MCM5
MADRQSAYSVSLFGSQTGDGVQEGTAPSRIQQALVDFIMEFTIDNVFIYRHVLRSDSGYVWSDSIAETRSAKMCL